MGKVIPFEKFHARRYELDEAQKLVNFSTHLDNLIIDTLSENQIEVRDLAGVLAHRLGALIKNLDQKQQLWQVYERLLKKQAAIVGD